MLRRLGKIALPFIAILTCSTALAQDTDNSEETKANTIDEVIVEGIHLRGLRKGRN